MPDTMLADTLAALRKRLRVMEDERAKLRKAIEAIGALVEPDMQQTDLLDSSDGEDGDSEGRLPTYAEAAETVLKGMGRPLHIATILDALHARWFPDKDVDDRNFSNAVYAAMNRREDVFIRTGPGTFGLSTWLVKEESAPAEAGTDSGPSTKGGETDTPSVAE